MQCGGSGRLGKTETLIGRVRHLLRDISPAHIAVVMFNRDAALSFRRRFEQAVKVLRLKSGRSTRWATRSSIDLSRTGCFQKPG